MGKVHWCHCVVVVGKDGEVRLSLVVAEERAVTSCNYKALDTVRQRGSNSEAIVKVQKQELSLPCCVAVTLKK